MLNDVLIFLLFVAIVFGPAVVAARYKERTKDGQH